MNLLMGASLLALAKSIHYEGDIEVIARVAEDIVIGEM